MKKNGIIFLIVLSSSLLVKGQTFRTGFDNTEYYSSSGNGQSASLQSNVSNNLHNSESVALQAYITMFIATKDKRYLDQFIIHAKRVQERRDDNITQLPFNQLQGFPTFFFNDNGDIECSIEGVSQIDPSNKAWSYVENHSAEDGCFYDAQAVVHSGTITFPMAQFVWYMQSDPDFIALANEVVPAEAQTVLASSSCATTTINTYQDFANWLECRITETINFHGGEWGLNTVINMNMYINEYLNGNCSLGRTTTGAKYNNHITLLNLKRTFFYNSLIAVSHL